MDAIQAKALLQRQRDYFATGATLPVKARKAALRALKNAIDAHAGDLYAALKADLGKSPSESYMCELGLVKSELSFLLRHVSRYAKTRHVHTPLALALSASRVKPCPYGTALIMSPWNYPVLLTLEPLADALAAGNTAIVKPSAYSPNVSAVLQKLVESVFPAEYVSVVTGGRAENQCLLELDVDCLFFTGSPVVGKEVMAQAAKTLTPVTLELGGKSPCIVDQTADVALAARRIVFGKFINCGQTCVAPDYVYCHADVKDAFIAALRAELARQYGPTPLDNEDYGKIVNQKHFDRLAGLLDPAKTVIGGQTQPERLRIAPTVLDNVTWDDPVMGEEIFGPILPILTYQDLGELMETLRALPHPLALYIFTRDKKAARAVTTGLSYGGGCVNDTLVHLATSAMPFGGVGQSGMGAYHGKVGFDTFTHYKSILKHYAFPDLPFRYQPYKSWKDKLIKLFVK